MKKILISVSAAIALIGAAAVSHAVIERNSDSLLEQNVEALMQQEHAYGKCEERENECIGRCPHCGELVYANGHSGPAYDIRH